MMNRLSSFLVEEDGAVSVDWVILAAGVLSLAMAATSVVIGGTSEISGNVEGQLKQPSLIKTSFD